jgi:hypothetical protein
MKRKFTTWTKKMLSKYFPNSGRLRYLASLPLLEVWRKEHKEVYPVFPKRQQLYQHLINKVFLNEPIDYLEFGVYKGASIKYFVEAHNNLNSRFYGFDTFTGLPEAWEFFSETKEEGHFSTKGEVPDIKDNRVKFIAGLFQDTLPKFLTDTPLSNRLVIHLDADIYSATLYVLTKMHDFLKPGTIIVFDEFSSVLHEFRALDDYCLAYRKNYKVLGATVSDREYYVRLAIEIQ